MASLRRHRRGGIAEAEDDYDDDDVHDDGSGTASPDIDDTATEQEEEEEDEEEEDYRLHLGLHSMTAKVPLLVPLHPSCYWLTACMYDRAWRLLV
jgi:exocyst complex component 8